MTLINKLGDTVFKYFLTGTLKWVGGASRWNHKEECGMFGLRDKKIKYHYHKNTRCYKNSREFTLNNDGSVSDFPK